MLLGILRTMRPHQWVKNLVVIAPLVFALELFDVNAALRALAGFVVFCLVSGTVYVLNDLVDVEADREHPVKKKRPIASGQVPPNAAKVAVAVLAVVSALSGLSLGLPFLGAAMGYLVGNVLYSFWLKKIAYVDVLCIAVFFELRALAGSFAAEVPASAYLLVFMFLLASFLGLGKRAHELALDLAKARADGGSGRAEGTTRSALRAYDARVLTPLLYGTAIATIAVYGIYTFDPTTASSLGTPWMPLTNVFLVFGVLRFAYLVRSDTAHSPTDAMLRDPPFVVTMVLSALALVAILYLT